MSPVCTEGEGWGEGGSVLTVILDICNRGSSVFVFGCFFLSLERSSGRSD